MISASFEEERFKGKAKDVQRPEREAAPEKLRSRQGELERSVPPGKLTAHGGSTHQLVFLHDMKLVDPAELYPSQQPLLDTAAVEARNERRGQHSEEERTGTPYLEFMDEAMGKYAAQDRKGCLKQLFVLLAEKPEDVNALFYAGLCSYDLGLFQRAASYFEKVRQGPIDSFDEEAEWYQALTQEQLQGAANAKPMFQRIAQRGGFYAARADLRLQE
jgi:tetratricopeptide (TPR) repeat protein